MVDKLHAGSPENRDTNHHRLKPPCFYNSYKPQRLLWYAQLTAIYYINMLNFYMRVYYLPRSLFCSSNFDLHHGMKNNRSWGMMCSVITWPVGGNTCILSGWVSAKELLLQSQQQAKEPLKFQGKQIIIKNLLLPQRLYDIWYICHWHKNTYAVPQQYTSLLSALVFLGLLNELVMAFPLCHVVLISRLSLLGCHRNKDV